MAERTKNSILQKKKRLIKKKNGFDFRDLIPENFVLDYKKLGIAAGILAAAILLLVGISSLVSRSRSSEKSVPVNLQEGIDYLSRLETRDTGAIQDKINAIKKKERRAALENGDVSVWSLFYDYAILGDSRAVGFSFYGFLDENRVLAELGNTIYVVPDRLPQLQALNPSNIFLCYGINDVISGLCPTADIYAEEMDKTVQLIQEAVPGATIYINSIFPAQDPAFLQFAEWYNIPDYNAAIKALCNEKGYHYIDNDVVFEEHSDLYDIDGIHFLSSLYDYWAVNMITEME